MTRSTILQHESGYSLVRVHPGDEMVRPFITSLMTPGRKRILQNVMNLYRDNLRDNTDLDAIILDKYIKAVQLLHEKLELTERDAREAAMAIQAERERLKQLNLFQ